MKLTKDFIKNEIDGRDGISINSITIINKEEFVDKLEYSDYSNNSPGNEFAYIVDSDGDCFACNNEEFIEKIELEKTIEDLKEINDSELIEFLDKFTTKTITNKPNNSDMCWDVEITDSNTEISIDDKMLELLYEKRETLTKYEFIRGDKYVEAVFYNGNNEHLNQ